MMVVRKPQGWICGGLKLDAALVLRRAVRWEESTTAAVAACGAWRFDNFRPTIYAANMILEVWRTARLAEVQDGDESENEIEIRVTWCI
ncbi:hypothetical protein OROMI_014675 [Orobanche minor]